MFSTPREVALGQPLLKEGRGQMPGHQLGGGGGGRPGPQPPGFQDSWLEGKPRPYNYTANMPRGAREMYLS